MASVFYHCNHLSHQVFEPETMPETHYPAPPSVQIEVTVTADLQITHHDCLGHRFTGFNTYFSQGTLRFDLNLLENYVQAYEILGALLTRFRLINPASFAFCNIVSDIILNGFIIGHRASNRGRKVLPLRVEIQVMVEKHVNNESALMRRAMEESALADESSVEKVLKRVKLADGKKGKDCVICLEEINVGSDASQMPCSHIFHGACIEQWLKQSHYCPICRFKVSISES